MLFSVFMLYIYHLFFRHVIDYDDNKVFNVMMSLYVMLQYVVFSRWYIRWFATTV